MTAAVLQARGFLVTPDQAAELVGVTRGAIDVWKHRGHLRPAWDRPLRFWSDDVYDTHAELRPTRDQRGRFAPKNTPL